MQVENMPIVRVLFQKTSRAKYTSHLDTMRTITRALRRSYLPLWYTQGFNPHLYMTFALPIALGCESLCESLDLRMTQEVPMEEVVQRLNQVLPPGIRAVSAAPPEMKPDRIAWADYTVNLLYQGQDMEQLCSQWDSFVAQPSIVVEKRTKKGETQLDIRPLTQILHTETAEQCLTVQLRLAAGISTNVSPSLLLKAFYAWSSAQPGGVQVLRTAILTEKLENFR